MTRRAILTLNSQEVRNRALDWINRSPAGTRVTFQAPKRSLDQNALLWTYLGDVASQVVHNGRKYPSEAWKHLFLAAIGREVQFIEGLDGQPVQWGRSSSDLSKAEMSELLDFIGAYGAEHGVVFKDTPEAR